MGLKNTPINNSAFQGVAADFSQPRSQGKTKDPGNEVGFFEDLSEKRWTTELENLRIWRKRKHCSV